MSATLYSILSTDKRATRDGQAGASASLLLPFTGGKIWFANGNTYTFPNTEIPQDASVGTFYGRTKPHDFQKDCCGCPSGF